MIDQRLRDVILQGDLEDEDIVIDLRHLNQGRPKDLYKPYFEIMLKKVNDKMAADDRRHGIEHMDQFTGISNLMAETKADCPEGTKIPSETTVYHTNSCTS